MLGLKNPKASLNLLLKKYEENELDIDGLKSIYPIQDARGCLQETLMVREDEFHDLGL